MGMDRLRSAGPGLSGLGGVRLARVESRQVRILAKACDAGQQAGVQVWSCPSGGEAGAGRYATLLIAGGEPQRAAAALLLAPPAHWTQIPAPAPFFPEPPAI